MTSFSTLLLEPIIISIMIIIFYLFFWWKIVHICNISCKLWKERNVRANNNELSLPPVVFSCIHIESRNLVLAGAKHLGNIMPRE